MTKTQRHPTFPRRRSRAPRLASSRRAASNVVAMAFLLAQAPLAPALAAEGGSPVLGAHEPATPAARPAFSLGMEQALPALRIAAAAPPGIVGPDAGQGGGGLGAPRLPDLRRLATFARQPRAQETTAEPSPRREGGFGRWLKRHWWVPVLVGGAAAYAISESGGDDDRLGEDD